MSKKLELNLKKLDKMDANEVFCLMDYCDFIATQYYNLYQKLSNKKRQEKIGRNYLAYYNTWSQISKQIYHHIYGTQEEQN